MIIAINGKIGAGKDTVGKIIQYLCSVSYHKHDMSFNEFQDIFIEPDKVSSWKVKKYAKKLKEIASILTGIPIEKFEDQEFKKTFLGEEWNYYYSIELPNKILTKENYDKASVNQKTWFSKHEMTVRDLLQKLGTEALRNGLHENVWVNALFADYKQLKTENTTLGSKLPFPSLIDELVDYAEVNRFPNWLITDLRFPNEFQAVKDRNGICVRVNRNTKMINPIHLHPSETSLDSFTFDYELDNLGSIEDLVEEVRKMLINFKII